MRSRTDPSSAKPPGAGKAAPHLAHSCRSTLERSQLPMAACEGAAHTILYVNPAFCHMIGKTAKELLGFGFGQVLPQENASDCMALLDRVYRAGTAESLADQEHAVSGSERVCWSYTVWYIPGAGARPAGVMIQITDTTEATLFRRKMTAFSVSLLIAGVRQQEATEATEGRNVELQALATTDGLTGLANHRAFQERLREEVERAARYATPLSLLFMDVDAFKSYNDTYGHPAGDAALHKIALSLQAMARASDLIARYGGEEFAVILPGTGAREAAQAAERFRAAVEAADWQKRRITISVGAATLSPTLRDASALIDAADKALYRSKERGCNCVTPGTDAEYEPSTNKPGTNKPGTKRKGNI